MKSNKTLFYPFDYHSYPLIHYLNKTRNDIVVAADAGSSLINRDISYAINSTQFENLKVHDIKEVCMDEIGEVYLLNEKVSFQIPKNTFYLNRLSYKKDYEIDMPIVEIEKPIIMITGLFDTIFNSNLGVDLKYEFEKKNIKCGILSPDVLLSYINAGYFYLDNENYKSLSNLYYQVKKQINCMLLSDIDVLIIQVQGGFMQLDDVVFNDFGIYYTILNEIASPDYQILVIPESYSDDNTVCDIQQITYGRYRQYFDYLFSKNFYVEASTPYTLKLNDDITFQKNSNNDLRALMEDIMKKLGESDG